MKKISPERERFFRVAAVILSAAAASLLAAASFRGIRLPLGTVLGRMNLAVKKLREAAGKLKG